MRPTPEELSRRLVVGIELEPRVINLAAGQAHDNRADSQRVLSMAGVLHPQNLPARGGETLGRRFYWGELYGDMGGVEAGGVECQEPAEAVLNVFILVHLLSRAARACDLRLALRSNFHLTPSSMHLNVSFGPAYAPATSERALAQAALALMYGNLGLAPGAVRSQRALHCRSNISPDWRERPLLHSEGKENLDLPPPWILELLRATEQGQGLIARISRERTARNHDGCYDLQPCPSTTRRICESHAILLMLAMLGELPARLDSGGLAPLAFLRRHNGLTVDADGQLELPEPVRAINRALARQAGSLAERHPGVFPAFFARRAAEWEAESSMPTAELAARAGLHGYVKYYAGLLPFLRERGVPVQEYLSIVGKLGLEPHLARSGAFELFQLAALCPAFVQEYLGAPEAFDPKHTKLLADLAALDLLLDVYRSRSAGWPEPDFFEQALRAGPRKVRTRADARNELLERLLRMTAEGKVKETMFYWTGVLVAVSDEESYWYPMSDVLEPALKEQDRVPVPSAPELPF